MIKSEISGFITGLRPTDRITVSQWAEKYRMLSQLSSPHPGRYSLEHTPYMREVMDCLSEDSPIREVVLMKAAQTGGTEAANNFVGYIMSVAPAPVMFVEPTIEMAKKLSQTRIEPMIDDCPQLQSLVSEKKSRDSKNTQLQKMFPNGVLLFSGANSSSSLRSQPVRYLILDEVDDYPIDLNNQGGAIELAKVRTKDFRNRKILYISTPTIKGVSLIEALFRGKEKDGIRVGGTDERYYYVKCPHCGHLQKLDFANLVYEEKHGRVVGDVCYACQGCGVLITESEKHAMLQESNGAQWIAERPEMGGTIAGFHINGLYGAQPWKEIVDEYLVATADPNKMKTFVNTALGETFEESGEVPSENLIYQRREKYATNTVCTDVRVITAGVDVQGDRLEMEIVGWCDDMSSYSIDYRVLMGNPNEPDVWAQLELVLNEQWIRDDGSHLRLQLTCIDSGYLTSIVYRFCRSHLRQTVAIKGSDILRKPFQHGTTVDATRQGKHIGGFRVTSVGSSFLKEEIYSYLSLLPNDDGTYPAGYMHFPEYDIKYFRGLTGEYKVKRQNKRGYEVIEWVKRYHRNEPLDCRVYARAAVAILGLDRRKVRKKVVEEELPEEEIKQPQQVIKPTKKVRKDNGIDISKWL